MNIYIDESGSFVSAKHDGAWNAVAALAAPEAARKGIEIAVNRVRKFGPAIGLREVKLRDIDEQSYFTFLQQLGRLPVALFCVATDAGLNSQDIVIRHQKLQAEKLRFNIPKMHFEAGRQGIEKLAHDVATLSPQLYVQLICQVALIHDALIGSVTYFVQRHPKCLREIRWRIDQKNADKPTFEKTFERITPAVLQTMSLERPFPMVREFDYSAMRQYEFAEGAFPAYLKDDYGIDTQGQGWNIGKMVRGNIAFVDSTVSAGVQAVDLVVSGIRRCLRREFHDNKTAADLLGSLTVQAMEKRPPIRLITLGDDADMHPDSGELVRRMTKRAKPMLL